MKVIIVERSTAVLYALNKYIESLFPNSQVVEISSISEGMELLTNNQDANFVFWAGEINEGLTTEGLLEYGVKTLPEAKHVAMSATPEEQMKQGCTIALPKPFTQSDFREAFKGILRQSKRVKSFVVH